MDTHNPPRAERLRWRPATAIGDSTLPTMADAKSPTRPPHPGTTPTRETTVTQKESEDPSESKDATSCRINGGLVEAGSPCAHNHPPTHKHTLTQACTWREEKAKLQQTYILVKRGILCTFLKKTSVSIKLDLMLRCVTAHRSTLNLQRHVEQFLGGLVQKVGVQHSDFTDIPQPDLRRWSPKAFSDLE